MTKQVLSAGGAGVKLFVSGRPRTKGSLKPVHRKVGPGRCAVALTEDGRYSEPWKRAMIAGIRAQCAIGKFPGAVVVDLFFRFDRLCAPDDAMPWPTREQGEFAHGDEDKLRRNALDALTQSGLLADDSLSVGGANWKRWTRPEAGEQCGVLIRVRAADEVDLAALLVEEARP